MTDEKTQILKGLFHFDKNGKNLAIFRELTELKQPTFGSIYIRQSSLKGIPVSVKITAEVQYE